MARKWHIAGIDLDYDDVIAELKTNPAVTAALIAKAKQVKDYWRSIAPVGDPKVDPDSGAYRDSIDVRFLRNRNGLLFARVEATDYKAHWIEYGTGEPYPTPEFACMRMTAAMFGLER